MKNICNVCELQLKLLRHTHVRVVHDQLIGRTEKKIKKNINIKLEILLSPLQLFINMRTQGQRVLRHTFDTYARRRYTIL